MIDLVSALFLFAYLYVGLSIAIYRCKALYPWGMLITLFWLPMMALWYWQRFYD